ncbi:hypothetical protein Q6348_13370 [Isoptericola sp. b441]|uniref:Uncharacterized protein n=1 Tax=Actinotalea lenta TaxID=3064654 RepID=A0ABT9DCF3_9CELL|nr:MULTISPECIES: hypothetical protein [unclassified Isoptericola]MDO8108186.1 hypothetical protein [Isoptericola sp. b441]MDO8120143.1 hypothetical protein [Isoptericola sp. b490]
MRAVRWAVLAVFVAYGAVLVRDQIAGRQTSLWFVMAPWGTFALLAVARVVREAMRSGVEPGVRRVVRPGFQGLDEVQAIQLGRPTGLVVTYGSDEPPTSALIEPHPDRLDAGPWTLRTSADGAVEVETGDDANA